MSRTDKKDLDGFTVVTDRKLASGVGYEFATVYPGVTFHFTKQRLGGKTVHAWIDADRNFYFTLDALTKSGVNNVKMFDWLAGLEHIDHEYGDAEAKERAKNNRELAQPRLTL